jgi:hypothetical protein
VEEDIMDKKLYKFIQYYLCCFKYLKHVNEYEKFRFIEWFVTLGNNEFADILKLNIKKGYISDCKKIVDYYDFLLRNSINQKDWELYINWMYSIPTDLNGKLKNFILK